MRFPTNDLYQGGIYALIRNVRNFSPRVTKVLLGIIVVLGSMTVAAGVVFATPDPAPGGPSSTHPATPHQP
jgi:hypothetical protein